MKVRKKAYDILVDICIHHRYSNIALKEEVKGYDDLDTSFITHIVYGTLQHYRMCRYTWISYVKKEPKKEIRVLLDMAVYQILYMDKVPTYAVVNESVEIAKQLYQGAFKNMVNAVLRKVIEHGAPQVTGNPSEVLAIITSHPTWLVKMWEKQYGYEVCEKICYENNHIRKQVARVNTFLTTTQKILEHNDLFEESPYHQDILYYRGASLASSIEFKEGLISIQDESSQLVAHFVDPQKGDYILDTCSAPGTKSAHMAELAKDEAHIEALDIHEHRVKLIEEGAKRLHLNSIHAKHGDATTLTKQYEEAGFDRVLVDVPCSGYGVLSRKSDIKYHMKSEDMDEIIRLQYAILNEVASLLKDQGVLVYSTCTLNKKENEKQIERFLMEHDDYQFIEQRTIFPFEYHSDGFFMAKLKREIKG